MKTDLKKRIQQFNEMKYTNADSKRIIIATLETVTTAPIYKE